MRGSNTSAVEMIKALKQIGYNGYYTLEADSYLHKYDENTVFEGIKELAATAKKFEQL